MTEAETAGAEEAPAVQAKPDHLYVIGAGDGIVKIGRSANPASRLSSIQTGNPRKMLILHLVPEAGELEALVHGEFSRIRLGGEWFNFGTGDPVAEVSAAIERIHAAEAKAAAAAELAAARGSEPAVESRPVNWKTPKPRGDACGPYDCSHFATLAVYAAAAEHFASAYPDEAAAFLAGAGYAWHCIESAFPALAQAADPAA